MSERLPRPRRCYLYERDKCPNYVNLKKPRKMYWERGKAEKVCWAYVCDSCWEFVVDQSEEWAWPTGDDGKFKGSMECSLP